MKLIDWMEKNNACDDARAWVGGKSSGLAWAKCKRADWMLWALGRTKIDKREIVRIACDLALCVMHLNDDPRVKAAIDAADGWCSGDVTSTAAAYAACAASDAAAYAAACAACAAACAAAYAACAASDAAACAGSDAAAYAAGSDAACAAACAACAAACAALAAYAAAPALAAYAKESAADMIRERVSAEWFSELVSE